ncbi:MAG: hypothetical protein R3C53_09510 [Pirellulaceae bacterium]
MGTVRCAEEGREAGREEGREEGREAGREEGEQLGLEKGKLAGKVQMLEELLGDSVSTDQELVDLGLATLAARLAELQQRLRDRPA